MTRLLFSCAVCLIMLCNALGCSAARTSPYTTGGDRLRDPARALSLQRQATSMLSTDPIEAERLLRESLTADLYFGPAHNNLGILLLERDDYYNAASEFEWARKLMPGHPDPRVNLAITLERAGKYGEAIEAYDSALHVRTGFLPAIQGKARAQIESGQTDNTTGDLLREIEFRGNASWVEWARLWRIKLQENDS